MLCHPKLLLCHETEIVLQKKKEKDYCACASACVCQRWEEGIFIVEYSLFDVGTQLDNEML